MEQLTAKIEQFIDRQIAQFEEHPVTTSLKMLFFYWIFKRLFVAAKRG